MKLRLRLYPALLLALINCGMNAGAETPYKAYDIDMAKEICSQLPLEEAEGIWIYPEDRITVMILKDRKNISGSQFPSYIISVVETSDASLHPGDIVGNLTATTQAGEYRISLSTEKKNDLLLKPKSCLATLSKDNDAFIIKKQKSPFKTRLNLNFSRLLPGFWKMVSTGISTNSGNGGSTAPRVGMIKIYPSYDGNGSSRRSVRYL